MPASIWHERNFVIILLASFLSRFLLFIVGIVNQGLALPNSEPWMDFAYAYVPSVHAFTSGYLPYVNFYHAYPPLFLYVLTVFSFLPASWAMALPLIISDGLTVVPLYLIAKRFMNERAAFLASLLFAVAPINLFYVDYLWLNPPLTTLFLMTSIYYLLQDKYNISAVLLALSIGFKQTALFALPILLLFLSKKISRKSALKYLTLVTAVCFVFSVPYIFLAPQLYLYSILRVPIGALGSLPANYFQLGFTGPPGAPTTIDTATLTGYNSTWVRFVPLNAPVNLALPIFIFLLPEVTPALYGTVDLTLTILLVASYLILLYKGYRKKPMEDKALIKYVLYALLLLFTIDSLYKYYIAGITPLLALLLQKRRDLAAFAGFNLALLLIPRVLASYLMLLVLLWLLRPQFSRLAFDRSRRSGSQQNPL